MNQYDLIIDPEFRRLLPELRPEEYKLLEESILAEGCREPIMIWNRAIVDGHHRYEICKKHNLPFDTNVMSFGCREEAIRWICMNQIGRRNINLELFRYQIGKRYNMEKLLSAHNPKGKNQYTDEVASEVIMRPQNEVRLGKAASIGHDYNISHFAVHTYKDIATAVDKIAEKDNRLSDKYLSGQIKIKKDDLETISELNPNQVKALTNLLTKREKRICRTQDILESLGSIREYDKENHAARERRKTASMGSVPAIKNMPAFDPDSEVASLSLTIPSWSSSIERVFNKTKLSDISDKAKTQLKAELLTLRDSVDLVLLAIEEATCND